MTKENKCKATLLTLLCMWPGFLMLANAGYAGLVLVSAYVLWLVVTLFIAKIVFRSKPIEFNEGTITPIYDVTLRQLGFRYNVQHERWQIGCIGAPCFVYYNPNSSCGVSNLIECNNFISGNDEHMVRIVHSIEEIKLVLNSCGITEGMVEKAQDTWQM